MKALTLFFLLPLVALASGGSSVFIVSRATDKNIDSAEASSFRDALAAELAGYGFTSAVRADQFAEETGTEKVNDASTLNQARQAGASYALVSTLRDLKTEVREYSGNGVKTANRIYSLSFSYRLLSASDGAVLTGGNGSVRKTLRATQGAVTVDSSTTGDLLSMASTRIAEEVAAALQPSDLVEASPSDTVVPFTITARGMGMTIPEVTELDSGELYVTGERNDITLDAVTVMIDGVAVGSAPGELESSAGLHEVTLQREGFEDWTRTVNIREGLDLVVRMSATDAEIKRFRQQSAFLEGLRTQRVLTDAEAEKVLGIAQMFSQSGFRWDIKQDIKVDTDEPIKIEQNNRTLMGDNKTED
ncbi:MAG: PEGA domain-containing protein [Puniceicoccales bacterium]